MIKWTKEQMALRSAVLDLSEGMALGSHYSGIRHDVLWLSRKPPHIVEFLIFGMV